MPSSQSDYILRLVEQLGAALRRMRERLARDVSAAPEVLEEAARAQAELLGPLFPTLRSVDAATAVGLVPDSRQVEMWTALLELEAEAAALLGNEAQAAQLRGRAGSIRRALVDRAADG